MPKSQSAKRRARVVIRKKQNLQQLLRNQRGRRRVLALREVSEGYVKGKSSLSFVYTTDYVFRWGLGVLVYALYTLNSAE